MYRTDNKTDNRRIGPEKYSNGARAIDRRNDTLSFNDIVWILVRTKKSYRFSAINFRHSFGYLFESVLERKLGDSNRRFRDED